MVDLVFVKDVLDDKFDFSLICRVFLWGGGNDIVPSFNPNKFFEFIGQQCELYRPIR